jgi:S-formylglutathione hydrolase FrmB
MDGDNSPVAKGTLLTFPSPAVRKAVRVIAFLPPKAEKPPVLYLLHGRNSSPEYWTTRTSLPTLLAGRKFAVVCLTGENGFYTNSLKGDANWEDSLLCDQIPGVEERFGLGRARARRMIAGFSMGGFGAMKLALKYSDRFCGVYTISGSFGSAQRTDEPIKMEIFGPPDSAQRRRNDPFLLAAQVPRDRRPAIEFDCGLSDSLLGDNRRFHPLLQSLGWQHVYTEYPGGHSSAYVDARLPEMLAFAQRTFDYK